MSFTRQQLFHPVMFLTSAVGFLIVIEARDVQPSKASVAIFVIPVPISTVSREPQL